MLNQLREAKDELTDTEAHEALSEAAPANGGGEEGKQVGVAFLEVRRLLGDDRGIRDRAARHRPRAGRLPRADRRTARSTCAGSSVRTTSPTGTTWTRATVAASRSTDARARAGAAERDPFRRQVAAAQAPPRPPRPGRQRAHRGDRGCGDGRQPAAPLVPVADLERPGPDRDRRRSAGPRARSS